MTDFLKVLLNIRSLRAVARDLTLEQLEEGLAKLTAIVEERRNNEEEDRKSREERERKTGLTHQCLYFEQPHTFEQILFIQTAEPALVGHAQIT